MNVQVAGKRPSPDPVWRQCAMGSCLALIMPRRGLREKRAGLVTGSRRPCSKRGYCNDTERLRRALRARILGRAWYLEAGV